MEREVLDGPPIVLLGWVRSRVHNKDERCWAGARSNRLVLVLHSLYRGCKLRLGSRFQRFSYGLVVGGPSTGIVSRGGTSVVRRIAAGAIDLTCPSGRWCQCVGS
jgi:hypothetical protein